MPQRLKRKRPRTVKRKKKKKQRRVGKAIQKACIMKNTSLYGLSVRHSSHSAQSNAAEYVRVRTDCAVLRPKAHWTRCRLDKNRFMTGHLHRVSWPSIRTT